MSGRAKDLRSPRVRVRAEKENGELFRVEYRASREPREEDPTFEEVLTRELLARVNPTEDAIVGLVELLNNRDGDAALLWLVTLASGASSRRKYNWDDLPRAIPPEHQRIFALSLLLAFGDAAVRQRAKVWLLLHGTPKELVWSLRYFLVPIDGAHAYVAALPDVSVRRLASFLGISKSQVHRIRKELKSMSTAAPTFVERVSAIERELAEHRAAIAEHARQLGLPTLGELPADDQYDEFLAELGADEGHRK
jgi:hypothetical protein